MAYLFHPKTAVIEYRPALIDGSYTWYWSLLPLPDEAHAFAHGHGKSRGAAGLEARQNARKHGYRITSVRIKHNVTEAAGRRIRSLMEARRKPKAPPTDPDTVDPKEALNALPARYWLVSIEAVQAQEVIDYYVIAFDEGDAVERLRKRGVIRPEPEDYVAAIIEVPKSDYDQFLKWQDEFGVYESVSSEAAKAEEPTDAQAEAGNYKKGHVSLFGMDISIENAKGSTRSGKNKQGKEWSVTMPAHYGYIKGTKGKDKDHIDVYIGPDEDSEKVYVVNQQHEEGGFDEHKCMICFPDREKAIAAYDKAFTGDLGPKLRQSVVTTTMDKFKEWLESGDPKKPFKSLAESLLEADPDEVDPKAFLNRTFPTRGTVKDFAWALDSSGIRAVAIRKKEDGWHIQGHYFGRLRPAKKAIKQVLEQFRIGYFPWMIEEEEPNAEITRLFHTIVPQHLLDGGGAEDQSFPPGYMIRN